MGNAASNLRKNTARAKRRTLHNLGRAYFAIRSMTQRGRSSTGFPAQNNGESETLSTMWSLDPASSPSDHISVSESESTEHLITMHMSCTEATKNCTIHFYVYNNAHVKVMEGTIYQDLTRDSESEGFMSATNPHTGSTMYYEFVPPFDATVIKTFFQQFSGNLHNN